MVEPPLVCPGVPDPGVVPEVVGVVVEFCVALPEVGVVLFEPVPLFG